MKNMMEYQGYFGSVNYNDEDGVFYGKLEYIRSLVSYEGYDVESLRASFHEAVDDYLELCEHLAISKLKIKIKNLIRDECLRKKNGINLKSLIPLGF